MIVGIIGAMEKEIKEYISLFNLEKSEGIFEVYEGNYNNKKIVLMESGIGKVNSASTTQYLIDKYNPNYIINSGCAGSLVNEIKILDVIIGEYVTYHDFNPVRIMEISTPNNGKVYCDETLVNITKNTLDKLNQTYHHVPICSGDCFVTDEKQRDEIVEKTLCKVVDMESASIGHISKKNNVPFLIIRSISDFADGVEEQEERAANIATLIVKDIVKEL